MQKMMFSDAAACTDVSITKSKQFVTTDRVGRDAIEWLRGERVESNPNSCIG